MIPHGDTFEVEYGRVGATCQHASYSMSQWDKKYKEKIKKGYVDQTHLVQDLIQKEPVKSNDGYKEIENKVIAEIVQRLQDMARQKIQANYKVSSQQVTQAMVDEAQNVSIFSFIPYILSKSAGSPVEKLRSFEIPCAR